MSKMWKSLIIAAIISSQLVATTGIASSAGECYVSVPRSLPNLSCECTGSVIPDCGDISLVSNPWNECAGGQSSGYENCRNANISPGTIADCDINWDGWKITLCLALAAVEVPICAAACTTIVLCLECIVGAGAVDVLLGCTGCGLVESCDPVNQRPIFPQPMDVAHDGWCPSEG